MSNKLDALLQDLLRGTISDDERSEAEAIAQLGLELPPIPPPSGLLDALLKAAQTAGPYDHHVGQVAQMLGVDRQTAQTMVDGIADPAKWEKGLFPGVIQYHLESAAELDAITGFVRIEAGTHFPDHEHLGAEHVLVLEGSAVDTESGRTFRAGDLIQMGPHTHHGFTVSDEGSLLYLVVIFGGLRIGDLELRPGDPRI